MKHSAEAVEGVERWVKAVYERMKRFNTEIVQLFPKEESEDETTRVSD